MTPQVPDSRRAFTLVELLVVIVILATLMGILLPALNSAKQRAEMAETLSNIRQVGIAISLYAPDHEGKLPGPMWPGQYAVYDKNREGRLVRELAPYLQIAQTDTPYLVEKLLTPAYQKAMMGQDLMNCRIYVLNTSVNWADQSGNPWGSLVPDQPKTLPISSLLIEDSSRVWALSEADQKHPAVANASWAANTPSKPIHGVSRMTLFFDWHVEPVRADP